jgi:hypothetical protein
MKAMKQQFISSLTEHGRVADGGAQRGNGGSGSGGSR